MKPKKLKPSAVLNVSRKPLLLSSPVVTERGVIVAGKGQVAGFDGTTLQESWRIDDESIGAPILAIGGVVLLARWGEYTAISDEDGRKLWGPVGFTHCAIWRGELLTVSESMIATRDAQNGATKEVLSSDKGLSLPSTAEDLLVGIDEASNGVAYDLGERRIVWSRDLKSELKERAEMESQSVLPMAAGAGSVMVSSDSRFGGCSAVDGSLIFMSPHRLRCARPSAGGGYAYPLFGEWDQPARLQRVDLKTGDVLYDVPQPLIDGTDSPAPGLVTADTVRYSMDSGKSLVLRIEDGALLWWCQHRRYMTVPVPAGSRALATTSDGKLLVFEPPAGS